MFSSLSIRAALEKTVNENKPIIGVATGSGLSAKQAYEGGADFILALSAGRFRLAGVPSLACMLPFSNSNDLVFDFAEREIIPMIKDIPVIYGACATDLTYTHEELVKLLKKKGFSGINNFPTVGLIDGKFREALEQSGISYQKEIELMKTAVENDLFTVAFVFDISQGIEMAKVGVDVVCAHLGWTSGGEKGVKKRKDLEECIYQAEEIFNAVDKINSSIFKMIYGGPVEHPEQAFLFYENSQAVGYIGGSSFERIPTEFAIREVTDKFKNYYKLKKENRKLKLELIKKKGFDEIVGQSRLMQDIYDIVNKVADRNINVLVQGESGTGKELVVRSIHNTSGRFKGPFIKINCATLPKGILESELFGHEKGSFTGAEKKRLGKFELADKGTLFLDEIGEMDLEVQAKLLRIIQEKEFERVGGSETIKVDVRIIAATNVDLREAVKLGTFREDLYYRLNVINILTPPLREHKEDIPLLVNHFLKEIEHKFDKPNMRLSPDVFDLFMAYDWPGNVRELKHVLERASILSDGEIINREVLPKYFKTSSVSENKYDDFGNIIEYMKNNTELVEKELILQVLNQCGWNRTKAAGKLNISRKTLYNKMKKMGIEKNG